MFSEHKQQTMITMMMMMMVMMVTMMMVVVLVVSPFTKTTEGWRGMGDRVPSLHLNVCTLESNMMNIAVIFAAKSNE